MTRDVASKRYAKALFEIGVEKDSIEPFMKELKTFKDLSGSGTLAFLNNPVFSDEEKIKVSDELLKRQKASQDFMNFIHILIEEKRAYALPEIFEEFMLQLNEYKGQEKAMVYSAVKLSEKQLESLSKTLSKKRGKKLILENVVDESIVGGLKITIGSFLYDASVRGMLDKLKLQG